MERAPDEADRRRTIVQISPAARPQVEEWLDGAAAPLARVLDRLAADERAAFLKAMDMLEAEFRASDGNCPATAPPPPPRPAASRSKAAAARPAKGPARDDRPARTMQCPPGGFLLLSDIGFLALRGGCLVTYTPL